MIYFYKLFKVYDKNITIISFIITIGRSGVLVKVKNYYINNFGNKFNLNNLFKLVNLVYLI